MGTKWITADVITFARMNQKTLIVQAAQPALMYVGMLWFDTDDDKLKQRNAANNGWIERPGITLAATISGLWTFDRGAAAPFAVDAASLVVPNLNVDKLDGEHAAAIVTDGRVKAHFPDTIVNILSDHNLANHHALFLGIDNAGKLVLTQIGTKVADLATLWTKGTKIVFGDITGLPGTIASILTDHDLTRHPLAIIPNMDDAHIPTAVLLDGTRVITDDLQIETGGGSGVLLKDGIGGKQLYVASLTDGGGKCYRVRNITDAADLFRIAADTKNAELYGNLSLSGQHSPSDGLVNPTKTGAFGDADFVVDSNGLIGIDDTGGSEKLYFRAGEAWFFINKSGGFTFPERNCPKCGDPFKVGDETQMVIDRDLKDQFHAVPMHSKCSELNKKLECARARLSSRVSA